MLPRGLPRLVYEIVHPTILKNLKVICLNRKEERGVKGRVGWHDGYWRIKLYPTVILQGGSELRGTLSFGYWQEFLRVILHEIGHIMTNGMVSEMYYRQYDEDLECKRVVEHLADSWMDRAIEKIANRDPRLGQPLGWIGGLPGLYLIKWARICRADGDFYDAGSYGRIKDIRAYRCGGQYSIGDVMRMGWTGHSYLSPTINQRILRMIKRLAPSIGITRFYIDRAGRKHLFFNHGEAVTVSTEVGKAIPESWHKDNREWRAIDNAMLSAASREADTPIILDDKDIPF